MTEIEQMRTLRKTIRHLYIQNTSSKAIIEDLQKSMILDFIDIPTYEETMKLLDEIFMRGKNDN